MHSQSSQQLIITNPQHYTLLHKQIKSQNTPNLYKKGSYPFPFPPSIPVSHPLKISLFHPTHRVIVYNNMLIVIVYILTILHCANSAIPLPAQNHSFYTSTEYQIPLGRNVVDVDINSTICSFDPSSPNLTLISNVSVLNPSPNEWSEDEVFYRIRDLQTQKAEFLAEIDDYILLLRGGNNIMVLSQSLMRVINQYAIPELGNSSESYKFKSNNSVVIIKNGSMFTCDKFMYSSRPYFGTVNNSVYLNSTLFAVISLKKIEIYDIGNKDITLKKTFDEVDIKSLHKNINTSNVNFTTCKQREDTLYCLCSSIGLFLIDSRRLSMISVIKKQNCMDFVPGNNSVYFQCEFYQDFFISSYPDTKVLSFFPGFIQSMQIFDKDHLLFQHASKLTFWNPETRKQKQINLNDHIVQVDIVRQYTALPPASTLSTFLLVLFKGSLHKYEYGVTTPRLICFSEKSISSNVSYELKLIDGSKIPKQIKVQVSEYVNNSINKKLVIGLIVLLVTVIMGMILVVCYYEKIVRNLRGVYIYMKRKRGAGRHVQV